MKFEYSSNNSGGSYWLNDKDWFALEAAGWVVKWETDPVRKSRRLAIEASKDFETSQDCIAEFERITGRDVTDDGCNCCGPPHCFSWPGGWASGSDLVFELYPDAPRTLREAAERLSKKR